VEGLTWRQALLQLIRLVRVLKHEGVEVTVASDLELDLVVVRVLLYAGGYSKFPVSQVILQIGAAGANVLNAIQSGLSRFMQ